MLSRKSPAKSRRTRRKRQAKQFGCGWAAPSYYGENALRSGKHFLAAKMRKNHKKFTGINF